MSEENILNAPQGDDNTITALTTQLGTGNIALWSEDKKKDFVKTFDDRSKVARFILVMTAYQLLQFGTNRHFVSKKHERSAQFEHETFSCNDLYDPCRQGKYGAPATVGGRKADELQSIANKRADAILNELPQVKKALEVILPDVAAKMDRRDHLQVQGQAIVDQLDEICEPIYMSSMPEDTTLKEFKVAVQAKIDARNKCLKKLTIIGEEGCRLEDEINKALYHGIPGLSEAVIKVVKDHLERARMFDQMQRRVGERVLFGDSKEALDILSKFEKDEIEVSDNIKVEFKKVVEALNLSGLRRKKAVGK